MFGAAVLFQACSRSVSSAKQSAIPVKATAVVTKTMPLELTAIGNVQPMESVDVTSQVTGRIITVDFKEGDFVKKGQLLFSIDSRPFVEAVKEANANLAQSQAAYHVAEANLRNAEAQYGAAKSNVLNQNAGVLSAQGNLNSLKAESDDALSLLNKQKALYGEGIISERDLEVAETSYKTALARYQQGEAQVNQAQVVAKSASSSGVDQAGSVVQQMQSQIQSAEAVVQQNQAAVDNAKVQLSYTQITSPVDGRAGNLNITKGNLVTANASTPLVSINSMSPIFVTFSIPEKDLSRIQQYPMAGIEVTAQIDAKTSRNGTLSSLDNKVSETTGTIQLKASFDNSDQILYPGRFVNITVTVTTQPDMLVIPAAALQMSQQGQFVYVVRPDNVAETRNVTLDRTIGDEAVIASGLKAGETVVTDGQLRLTPNSPVQIVADTPTPNSNGQSGDAK